MEGCWRWSVRLPERVLSAGDLHDMGGYLHCVGLVFVLLSVYALVVIALPLRSYRKRETRSSRSQAKNLSPNEKALHHPEHFISSYLSHEWTLLATRIASVLSTLVLAKGEELDTLKWILHQ